MCCWPTRTCSRSSSTRSSPRTTRRRRTALTRPRHPGGPRSAAHRAPLPRRARPSGWLPVPSRVASGGDEGARGSAGRPRLSSRERALQRNEPAGEEVARRHRLDRSPHAAHAPYRRPSIDTGGPGPGHVTGGSPQGGTRPLRVCVLSRHLARELGGPRPRRLERVLRGDDPGGGRRAQEAAPSSCAGLLQDAGQLLAGPLLLTVY
jgi:hypothetical protein